MIIYIVDRDSADGPETDCFLNLHAAHKWAAHCGLEVREENTCDECLDALIASCDAFDPDEDI